MKCPYCKHRISEKVNFCPYCREEIVKRHLKISNKLLLGFALLQVFIIAVLVYVKSETTMTATPVLTSTSSANVITEVTDNAYMKSETTITTTPALTSISSANVITEVTDSEFITEPINDYIQKQEDIIITSVERIEYNGLENNNELFNLIYPDINMNNRLTISLNGNSDNKQTFNCIEISNDEYNRIDFDNSNNWKTGYAGGTYEKKEYSELNAIVITLYGKMAVSTNENGEWDYSNVKEEQIKIVITDDEKGEQHIGVVDTIN